LTSHRNSDILLPNLSEFYMREKDQSRRGLERQSVHAYASSKDGQVLYVQSSVIAAAKNPQVHLDLQNTPKEELEDGIKLATAHMQEIMDRQPLVPKEPKNIINPEAILYSSLSKDMEERDWDDPTHPQASEPKMKRRETLKKYGVFWDYVKKFDFAVLDQPSMDNIDASDDPNFPQPSEPKVSLIEGKEKYGAFWKFINKINFNGL
jgi:hypothetical protein